MILDDPFLTYSGAEKPVPDRITAQPAVPCTEPATALALKVEDSSKTPVQILNEIEPNAVFELVKEDSATLSHRYLALTLTLTAVSALTEIVVKPDVIVSPQKNHRGFGM